MQVSISGDTAYMVTVSSGLLQAPCAIVDFVKTLTQRLVIIYDKALVTVAKQLENFFIEAGLACETIEFIATEENKTREQKIRLEDKLLALGCQRHTCVLALGGGITTDMAGFIAANYMRGVPLIMIPSTLLSMVDAAVGGKAAVNTPQGKNLIGAFYPPRAVYIDPTLLKTLPHQEFVNGMAEVIKHALLSGEGALLKLIRNCEALFALDQQLLSNLILENVKTKAEFVIPDEKDNGLRQYLNLGHTVAHALERVSDFSISHGQAVASGLVLEAKLGEYLGICTPGLAKKIQHVLGLYYLNEARLQDYTVEAVIDAMEYDKKNHIKTQFNFVFLCDVGVPYRNHAGGISVSVKKEIVQAVFAEYFK